MNYFDCMKFIELNGFQEFNLRFPHFREYFFNTNFIYVFENADGYFRLVPTLKHKKYCWQNIFEPTYIICDNDLQKLLVYAGDKLLIFQNNKNFDEWYDVKLSERKQEKTKSEPIEDEMDYEALINKIGISEFNLRMPHLRKRFFNPSYIYVCDGKQSIYKLSSLGKEGKYTWHDLLKTKNQSGYSDLENLLVMAGDNLKVFKTPFQFSQWFAGQMVKKGFTHNYTIQDELFFPFIPEMQAKMLKKLYDEIYPKMDEKLTNKKPIIGSSPLTSLGTDLHELLTKILEDRKKEEPTLNVVTGNPLMYDAFKRLSKNSMYGSDSDFHPLKLNKNAIYGVLGNGKSFYEMCVEDELKSKEEEREYLLKLINFEPVKEEIEKVMSDEGISFMIKKLIIDSILSSDKLKWQEENKTERKKFDHEIIADTYLKNSLGDDYKEKAIKSDDLKLNWKEVSGENATEKLYNFLRPENAEKLKDVTKEEKVEFIMSLLKMDDSDMLNLNDYIKPITVPISTPTKNHYIKIIPKSFEDSQKSISEYFEFRNSTPEKQKEHLLNLISEKIISEKQDEAKSILSLITDDEKSSGEEKRSRLYIYKMFLDTLPK